MFQSKVLDLRHLQSSHVSVSTAFRCFLAHVWKLSLCIEITFQAFGSCFKSKICTITRNKSRGQRSRMDFSFFTDADQFISLTSKGENKQCEEEIKSVLLLEKHLSVCVKTLKVFICRYVNVRRLKEVTCRWDVNKESMPRGSRNTHGKWKRTWHMFMWQQLPAPCRLVSSSQDLIRFSIAWATSGLIICLSWRRQAALWMWSDVLMWRAGD